MTLRIKLFHNLYPIMSISGVSVCFCCPIFLLAHVVCFYMCLVSFEYSRCYSENLFVEITRGLLLLLLGCFSHVRLCATPQTAIHQAPLSLGFSRQEHWSGVPLPFPTRGLAWYFLYLERISIVFTISLEVLLILGHHNLNSLKLRFSGPSGDVVPDCCP